MLNGPFYQFIFGSYFVDLASLAKQWRAFHKCKL